MESYYRSISDRARVIASSAVITSGQYDGNTTSPIARGHPLPTIDHMDDTPVGAFQFPPETLDDRCFGGNISS